MGQAGECAKRNRLTLTHYLVVEYPGYGLADGFSTQSLIEAVLYSVYAFVVYDLKVDPSRIVIIGRSVGTGIAAFLSAKLQSLDSAACGSGTPLSVHKHQRCRKGHTGLRACLAFP